MEQIRSKSHSKSMGLWGVASFLIAALTFVSLFQ